MVTLKFNIIILVLTLLVSAVYANNHSTSMDVEAISEEISQINSDDISGNFSLENLEDLTSDELNEVFLSLHQQGEVECGIDSSSEDTLIICSISTDLEQAINDGEVYCWGRNTQVGECPENIDTESINYEESQLELLSAIESLSQDMVECPDGTLADSIGNCEGVLEEEYESASQGEESRERVMKENEASNSRVGGNGGGAGKVSLNDLNLSNKAGVGNNLEFSNEEKEDMKRLIQNKSRDEMSGREFGLAIALQASENENVKSMRYDNETESLEIEHDENMKMFGLFNVAANVRTSVDSQGNVEEQYPWWSFLASKPNENETKFKAGAEISKSVN
ncbi:MAG: hypothetical protein ACLFPL_01870 [Candidatus Nanoarchaeia archaeon]